MSKSQINPKAKNYKDLVSPHVAAAPVGLFAALEQSAESNKGNNVEGRADNSKHK